MQYKEHTRFRLYASPTWFSRILTQEEAERLLPQWRTLFGVQSHMVACSVWERVA